MNSHARQFAFFIFINRNKDMFLNNNQGRGSSFRPFEIFTSFNTSRKAKYETVSFGDTNSECRTREASAAQTMGILSSFMSVFAACAALRFL